MKLDESGSQKLSRYKPCQQAQHANQYSDLRAHQEGTFNSSGLPPAGVLNFYISDTQPRNEDRRSYGEKMKFTESGRQKLGR